MSSSLTSTKKRLALETLNTARLRELVDALGLNVSDRRSAGAMRDAGHRVHLNSLFGKLRQSELKEICSALDIAATGKPKENLKRQILNGRYTAPQPGLPVDSAPKLAPSSSPIAYVRNEAAGASVVVPANNRAFSSQKKLGRLMTQAQHNSIVNFIWGIADDVLSGGMRDPRYKVMYKDEEFSLVTRSSDGQMLFLANKEAEGLVDGLPKARAT